MKLNNGVHIKNTDINYVMYLPPEPRVEIYDSYNNIVILNKDYIKIKDIPFYKYFTEHELKKCTNENYRIIFERKCKLKMLKNEGI